MKSLSNLVLLLQLVLFIQHHGVKITGALQASEVENENPQEKAEDLNRFRESYAQRMKALMNTSVDPCDDFYEYACGNYPNIIEDVDLTSRRNNLIDTTYILTYLIGTILQKTRDPDDEYYEELQKARQFVDSCINAKLWPIQQSDEYLKVLKTIGGFPAVDPTWNASAFDWFNMTAQLTRYGVDGFVKENIMAEHPFSPNYERPKLGLEFDVTLENLVSKESQGYENNVKPMRDLLMTYGVIDTKADKVIEGVVNFWREALLAEKFVEDNDACYGDDVVEFSKWKRFFEIAWETNHLKFTDGTQCPCDALYNKLDEIASKRPADVANYMALKFLYTMHPQIKSSKFQRLHCLTRLKDTMPIIISHFFMKEHYSMQSEKDIFEIVSEIKNSFQRLVQTADWLDESTKFEALQKVKTIRVVLGQIKDPIVDTLIKEAKTLILTDNFAANTLQMAKFKVHMEHYYFMHPDTPADTMAVNFLDALAVNAFNFYSQNFVNVLAGFLYPPCYHPNLPNSVKYGSLGCLLGHQFAQSLDSQGAEVDANLTKRFWWSNKSYEELRERSKCFAQQYSAFERPRANRTLSSNASQRRQDENINDSAGLREAFFAYRSVFQTAAKSKEEAFVKTDTLPGLDLTHEQTFFLSFAQIYCSNYTAKDLQLQLSYEHPLDKYRVLGSLQNFEEFSQVFSCSVGSPMNPEKKCRVW